VIDGSVGAQRDDGGGGREGDRYELRLAADDMVEKTPELEVVLNVTGEHGDDHAVLTHGSQGSGCTEQLAAAFVR
jgi:hypothetical protein